MRNVSNTGKRRSKLLPLILIGACTLSTLCSMSLMAAAVIIH